MISSTLLLMALWGAEPAAGPTVLPIESVTLYRNGLAWIRRAGAVPINEGDAEITIDPSALPESWSVDAEPKGPQPLSIVADPFGPLGSGSWIQWIGEHEGEALVFQLVEETFSGRVVPVRPGKSPPTLVAIETEGVGGIRLLDPQTIRGIGRAKAPAARLTFETKAREVMLRTGALVAGLNWGPNYRLDLGPEGQGRLVLTATLRNATGKQIEAPVVECALALPGGNDRRWSDEIPVSSTPLPDALAIGDSKPRSGGDLGSNDPTLYLVGKQVLQAGKEHRLTLLDTPLKVEQSYEWLVSSSAVSTGDRDTPVAERLEAILTFVNETDDSLPSGPILVTQGARPKASVVLPYTESKRTAELRIGPATGLTVTREETELERKKATIRRENEQYDLVQIAGSLSVLNQTQAPAKLRIIKVFEGEGIAASDNGAIQRRPNQVGRQNAIGEIRWDIVAPPGQTKRLTYGYQLNLGQPEG